MEATSPERWARRAHLDGIEITSAQFNPGAVNYNIARHAAVVFFTPERHWQFAVNCDRKSIGLAPAGMLVAAPAGSQVFAQWSGEKHSIRFDIEHERLKRLAGAEFGNDTVELCPPRLGFVDTRAHDLARLMRQEVQTPSHASFEALDALASVFAIHLLRHHSTIGNGRMDESHNHLSTGGLAPNVWRKVDEFIKGNLSSKLRLEQLASVAGLSPTHFIRAFKQTTGQPPHQYVLGCRLTLARRLITTTETPFSEITGLAGFSTNSHMTAAMKKAWRTTPSELRRS